MTTLDIILCVLLLLGAIRGFMKGFVAALCTLCGFLVGLLVAYMLNQRLGDTLAPYIGTSVTTARLVAFFLLWVVIPIGMGVVGQLITKLLSLIHLGFLNRLGGALMGFVKYFMVLTCCVMFASYMGIAKEHRSTSTGCVIMENFAKTYVKQVPKVLKNLKNGE